MDKNRIEGRHGASRWHNTPKANWYAPGGKCGGSAAEQRAITWGDLAAARRREVSRGHSTEIENRGAEIRPFKLGNPPARSGKDRTDKGQSDRVEDSKAMPPTGGAMLRASAMGSMGLLGQADSACSCLALFAGPDRNRRIRSRMSGGVGPVAG